MPLNKETKPFLQHSESSVYDTKMFISQAIESDVDQKFINPVYMSLFRKTVKALKFYVEIHWKYFTSNFLFILLLFIIIMIIIKACR